MDGIQVYNPYCLGLGILTLGLIVLPLNPKRPLTLNRSGLRWRDGYVRSALRALSLPEL